MTELTRGQKRPRESISLVIPNSISAPIPPIKKSISSSSSTNPNNPNSSRRIESVIFSGFEIQAEFNSPYPFEESTSSSSTSNDNARSGVVVATGGDKKSNGGGSRVVVVGTLEGATSSSKKLEGTSGITAGPEGITGSGKGKGKRKESSLGPSKNNNNNNNHNKSYDIISNLDSLLDIPPTQATSLLKQEIDSLPTPTLASRVPSQSFYPFGAPSVPLSTSRLPTPVPSSEPVHRTRRASSSSNSQSTSVPASTTSVSISTPTVTLTSATSTSISKGTLSKKPSHSDMKNNIKSNSSPHPHQGSLASTPGSVPFIEIEIRSRRHSSHHRGQSSPLASTSKSNSNASVTSGNVKSSNGILSSTSSRNTPTLESAFKNLVPPKTTRQKSVQGSEDSTSVLSSNTVSSSLIEKVVPVPEILSKSDKGKGKEKIQVDEKVLPVISKAPLSTSPTVNNISTTFLPQPVKSKSSEPPPSRRLFVCDFCFKYMLQGSNCVAHMKLCSFKHPPGTKVYSRGSHTIWEVDGATAKLYCQNLCLFAKLFIEHKYMFFDVEGFLFYVLTEDTPSRDYAVGYFSKEKMSYDDYNLACIVTFPPYQKKAFGSLLIEFSYELTRRGASTPGTPERPLSELGLRGYLTFWTSTLVRYFRSVLETRGGDVALIDSSRGELVNEDEKSTGAKSKKVKRASGSTSTVTTTTAVPTSKSTGATSTSMIVTLSNTSSRAASPNSTTLTLRRSATGISSASFQPPSSPLTAAKSTIPLINDSALVSEGSSTTTTTLVEKEKGWARPELQSLKLVLKPPSRAGSPSLTIRSCSTSNPLNQLPQEIIGFTPNSFSSTLPLTPKTSVDPNLFTRKFGLEEIALAVNLRVEDVAFALVESGLASWRRRERVLDAEEEEKDENKIGEGDVVMDGTGGIVETRIEDITKSVKEEEGKKISDEVVISSELLEEVARKFKVKNPLLDRAYVLL